ncbi:hypothetical protein SAMN05443245_0755 [Paraburkholderia fungorum]|uniref:Uncharacterized protein n=1 Tax=Paraburkholderia fungorum TaxID=134537 RepID=A0A1H0ZN07_9BURK|nr:hypothetical protein SAMN05443245_0755 [Paraburkholderia fungorum]
MKAARAPCYDKACGPMRPKPEVGEPTLSVYN